MNLVLAGGGGAVLPLHVFFCSGCGIPHTSRFVWLRFLVGGATFELPPVFRFWDEEYPTLDVVACTSSYSRYVAMKSYLPYQSPKNDGHLEL